jgi:NAD(P)-dependent dehydrogenase (short-subunit alcohol dehydrogenase family)
MFAINVRSQFLLTKGLVDILDTSRTSTVVAITSEAAEEVSVGRVAYSASKAASRSLFATLAAEGVSAAVVFQVRPGEVIATPGVRRRRPQNFDFGRYGDPTLFARRVVDQIVNADRTLSGRIVVLSGT